MAKTLSTMMDIGTVAPSFRLKDAVTDQMVSLDQVRGDIGTLVMFICNHCPYVKHIEVEVASLGRNYDPERLGIVAISSNDVVTYPQDGPIEMRQFAKQNNLNFPYLFDETQEVAKAYDAACTPDFFLFDSNLSCVYRGRFDASRPKSDIPVTGDELIRAIDSLLEGEPISAEQHPSMGCNIKWRM